MKWTQSMSCRVPVSIPIPLSRQVYPDFTGLWLLMVVHPLMLDELRALAKRFATGATGEGLLARVGP